LNENEAYAEEISKLEMEKVNISKYVIISIPYRYNVFTIININTFYFLN